MRNSVEKLTNKISEDSDDVRDDGPVYVKEQTMGVIVSRTAGSDDTSFTVSGNKSDYTDTELVKEESKDVLFSVSSSI